MEELKGSNTPTNRSSNDPLLDKLLSAVDEKASTQLLAEYDQLRKEIAQNDLVSLQVLGVVLVLSGALVTVAAAKDVNFPRWPLFLVLETVSLIGLRQNTERLKGTYIAASYIKKFIEPKLKYIQWETRLTKFRNKKAKHRGGDLIVHQIWMYAVLIFGNLALTSVFFSIEIGYLIWFHTCNIVAVIYLFFYEVNICMMIKSNILRCMMQTGKDIYREEQTKK